MKETNYPKIHVYGPRGWINDPNGLIYYKNQYHVFYQYYPHDVHWGPMHWGHAVSSDLRNWKYLSPALYPDEQDDGCFSGSAIEKDGDLYLIYTSFTNRDGVIRQQQAIAVSKDGIHFEKKGLIIKTCDIPEGYSTEDFRDPSVVKEGDKFRMYVASRKIDGRGRILVFESDDLYSWSFVKDFFGKDCHGTMIECPDKNGNLLTFSEQFFPTDIDGNKNIHASRYIVSEDGKNFDFDHAKALDYGFDFYAAQMFKSKSILMAWMSMWDRSYLSEKYGFAGELCYPRSFEIKDGKLIQKPYLNEEDVFEEVTETSTNEIRCKTGIVHIQIKGLKDLHMTINPHLDKYASFDFVKDELIFDRSHCDQVEFKETDECSLKKIRKMPIDLKLPTHDIYLVMDNGSIEIFVDGNVLSSLISTGDEEGVIRLNISSEDMKISVLKI